jgi:hypothetical protein
MNTFLSSGEVVKSYTMSVVWIGGVLPMAMEEDARRGYCYAGRESTL